MSRRQGVLKFFAMSKGYGFIKPDDGGPDVFLHVNDMIEAKVRWVEPGDKLTFETVDSTNGPRVSKLEVPSG